VFLLKRFALQVIGLSCAVMVFGMAVFSFKTPGRKQIIRQRPPSWMHHRWSECDS